MDEYQNKLLFEYLGKHYSVNEVAALVKKYPLYGSDGLRRMLAGKDREYFCKAYLKDQFEREFGNYARNILNTLATSIESKVQEKIAVIAPREHGKSSLSTFALPCWAALYKKKKFILFISSNGDTAANFLEKTKKALESFTVIEDFGEQKGRAWNADNICLVNGTWIACTGWKSGIRGLNKDTRPDLIILDDLEDKATMESDSLRRKLETCFREEIGRLGYYATDFFYIGTLLSDDSLLSRVSNEPAWRKLFFQAVEQFPDDKGEALWEQWRKIYRDVINSNRMDDAYKFYVENKKAMLKGVKVLWLGKAPPDKMEYKGAYYNIMLEREAWGEDSFWKEAQNMPRAGKDRPFAKLTYWNKIINVSDIKSHKLTIDPAEGKGQDSTGYTYGGSYNNAVIVIEGQIKDHNLNAIMNHCVWFIETYPDIDEIIIEENTYKEDGTNQLRKFLQGKGVYRKVTGFRSKDQKFNRILQMEPDINNGIILFNEFNMQYNNEVLSFSKTCKHDDAADSLHVLWKRFKRPNFIIR